MPDNFSTQVNAAFVDVMHTFNNSPAIAFLRCDQTLSRQSTTVQHCESSFITREKIHGCRRWQRCTFVERTGS